jgi:8-oxo-dGTP pyrophosphatase MutT (NUDIX family)
MSALRDWFSVGGLRAAQPKQFVVTCLFDPTISKVVMIRKTKPDFMAGKLNAVGGHVEPGEIPIDAATREFHEETGVNLPVETWHSFLTLFRPGEDGAGVVRILHCYWGISPRVTEVKTTTDEYIAVFKVEDLVNRDDIVKDTAWIVIMGREAARRFPAYELDYEATCMNPEATWQKLE